MLARSFLSAAKLGIDEPVHAALIQVLGILERGEVKHVPSPLACNGPAIFSGLFNMDSWSRPTECGTVCCIGGLAEAVGGLSKNWNCQHSPIVDRPDGLSRLLYPPASINWEKITPAQAAHALSNYLTSGEPRWSKIRTTDHG